MMEEGLGGGKGVCVKSLKGGGAEKGMWMGRSGRLDGLRKD